MREVLKHKTLKHVTMIEIDEDLIQIAREYLPKMSDCSSSTGRAKNCFDDSIVDVVNDNGLKWFVDRYGLNPTEKAPETQFDVILVDALDPEDDVPFNTDLYVDTDFVNSIMDSLSEEGVILIQIGTAPELLEPRGDLGVHRMREKLLSMFENHPSVAAMHVYEEAQSGFLDPHSFLMICKNTSCRNRWYARSDEIDYEIHDRVLRTESGEVSLKHYDGATQNTYQVPPKAWETVYCRREPTPFECNYIYLDHSKDIHELYLNDGEKSSFSLELEKNELGEIIGASLKTKVDIKEGSYIMPQHLASPLVLTEKSLESIRGTASLGAQAYAELYKFADENARLDQVQGTKSLNVEIGASVFIRSVEKADDANVDHWMPTHPTDRPKYSPVYDRHHLSFNVFLIATQDIPAGTELTRLRSRGSSKSDEFVV